MIHSHINYGVLVWGNAIGKHITEIATTTIIIVIIIYYLIKRKNYNYEIQKKAIRIIKLNIIVKLHNSLNKTKSSKYMKCTDWK